MVIIFSLSLGVRGISSSIIQVGLGPPEGNQTEMMSGPFLKPTVAPSIVNVRLHICDWDMQGTKGNKRHSTCQPG